MLLGRAPSARGSTRCSSRRARARGRARDPRRGRDRQVGAARVRGGSAPAPPPCCAPAGSSPRWSSRSPACTSCCGRCSAALDRLPAPQADALRGALGLLPRTRRAPPRRRGAPARALAETEPVRAGRRRPVARRPVGGRATVRRPPPAGRRRRRDRGGAVGRAVGVRRRGASTSWTWRACRTEAARALLDAHAERPVAADTAAWLHAATGGQPARADRARRRGAAAAARRRSPIT